MRAELHGDWHVHSTFSDDARSTLDEIVAAAHAAGVRELRCTEHVRHDTTWVPDFLAAVAALSVPPGLVVRTGVEAKLLDVTGALDVPLDLVVGPGGVDAVVVADHQVPTPEGPWSPRRTQEAMAAGLTADAVVGWVVEATIGAMRRLPGRAQLAHPFSILPKVGVDEAAIPDALLRRWAVEAAETGTLVEVNEKWACPRPRAVRAARDAGARVVASTDAHVAADVGRYDAVARILDEADR
ncbi:PHP domain-containing protein [Agrococcus sp. SGAir0287]|uniref:PHP domain-containing protein n=1 Tax=Agrococcus sp. SGAir0287 TaxID=2070347 RepID=UPI0010CD1AC9|nr:PHP domain-containing protein [Agrococcus sp. SGAir0287]QCR19403.1 histidinol-phosphatase [Agrococcus sp. SGAir0287]